SVQNQKQFIHQCFLECILYLHQNQK
ncbi:IS6 family transposase, partial [Bacillus cereus]